MRMPWLHHRPGPEENRKAAGAAFAVGAAVGAVVFYLARILLAREPLEPPPASGRALRRRSGEGEEE